ncbi:class I SAM-dependent RNA methyltransferase [Sphingomonas cavernae]|uniref:Class I SAM-dependent RNA methyltransferase n=1 Tax=Sphingomonas cavernae TaxID=2320861 RepID=A0A418W686_9SPHN|nr:class I SAM-dependent RNA methyltransferase [Sphingomonas cavernae]RJF85509.1 class I SAM-dependent RNA methyltransferase [Sphingomonas cavernae]
MTDTSEILRIAARGDGVTADGRYFPLTAPGDRVAVDGSIIPGPHHAPPACSHYPECGGCQLQHLDEESFARFVTERVVNALSGQQLALPEVMPAHISPPNSRRRASLRAERRGKKVLIGFNAGQSHRIVDMADCAILHPALFALIAPLRRLLGPMLREKRAGGVKMTLTDQGVDLLLDGIEADGLAAAESLSRFAEDHGLARLSLDDGYGPQTRWEPEPVTVTLGGVAVSVPHDAFLQATQDGEAALIAAVRDAIGDAPTAADLFSGLGTFALSVVEGQGRKVYAAEAARDAAFALKGAVGRVQALVFVEHRDLYRRPLTTAELDRFGAIILDPPRAGAEEQVKALSSSKAPRIAYVSCNPATFARDAKTLIAGGYRLDWVRPVGQFRWSTHVELAAAFTR